MNTTVNAPHSTSTHPMERSVWYFIVFGLFTLWVIYDGRRRSMGTRIIPWAVGTFLLGPIVLPIYFAKRPLRTGEVREGGFAWNVLRNFALFWTVLMVVVAISGIGGVANNQPAPTSDAEAAGAAIGTVT